MTSTSNSLEYESSRSGKRRKRVHLARHKAARKRHAKLAWLNRHSYYDTDISVAQRIAPFLTPHEKDPTKVMSNLVATEVKEYDQQKYLLAALKEDINIFCSAGSRLSPVGLEIEEWIHSNFTKYSLSRGPSGIASKIMPAGSVRLNFLFRRNNLDFEVQGEYPAVKEFMAWLEEQGFHKDDVTVNWAFGQNYRDMETFQLPLAIPNKIESAYPWLETNIEEYTKRFLTSKASILILIGPPGTGKTTFIKEMIKASGTSAMVTYDTDLLFSDGFFASFMTDDDCGLLILEDADSVMGSRKEGNTMMHKFLNASDGLVSLPRKKIIFTTNLPSVNDVDPALLRKGRCYDVINFRALSKLEAGIVAAELYTPVPALTKDKYTLAEITNLVTDPTGAPAYVAPKMGF